MKKIHVFIHTLNHSGLVHAAVMMSNGLVKKGYAIKLVVIGEEVESPYDIDNKIDIRFLNVKRGNNVIGKVKYLIHSVLSVRKYIKNEKAENLFVWGKEFTSVLVFIRCFFRLSAKIIGVNVTVVQSHLKNDKSFLTALLHRTIYKTFLNNANHIIAQSSGMISELVDVFSVGRNKINVANPPLPNNCFGIKTNNQKNNEIIFVGRLVDVKNPERMLRAFAKIKDKEVKLRVLGDGELMKGLKELASNLGIKQRVIFEGAKDNVIPFMQKAKLLVMTSRYEGFGMVVAEAIACGTPAVAVNCPVGPAEIIINGENGYLADYENDDELVELIDKALEREWDYDKVSKTVEKFSPDNVLPKYIEAIEKVFK